MSKKSYDFTKERYEEFIKEKQETDIVISIGEIFDFDKNSISIELKNENTYYIDISTFFISYYLDKPILIEKVLAQFSIIDNVRFIMNTNLSKKVKNLFPSLITDIEPINNIYQEKNECHRNFGNLTNEDITKITDSLNQNLYGHNDFKNDLIEKISDFQILNKLGEEKILSIFMCGKPGIGKTETARILHNSLYNYSNPIKINLGNYKTGGSLNSLIGSPKGYIGSERGGELTNKIKNSDSKVILIDEFDKADTDIYNFFYELLEDGKFTDLDENEYNLNGYLIIFTSNLDNNTYKEKIPAPIISRFSMLYHFSDIEPSEKIRFINYRINHLIDKYKKEYKIEIKYEDVLKNVNIESIVKYNDLRKMNRIIRKYFLKTIKECSIEK